jgi:hypothetical protein
VALEFANHDADEGVGGRRGAGVDGHEAEFGPLVEEVAVDVDGVGFGEVGGDQVADLGQEDGLERQRVLDVFDVGGEGLECGEGCLVSS